MNVYAIFGAENQPELARLIKRHFPEENRYALDSGDWFVASDKTSTEVGHLALFDGDSPDASPEPPGITGIVLPVAGVYWGYHDVDLWEWIESRRRS